LFSEARFRFVMGDEGKSEKSDDDFPEHKNFRKRPENAKKSQKTVKNTPQK